MTGLIWASFCVVVITFQVVCLFVFIFLLSHLYLKLSVSPGFFAIVVSSLAVAAAVYYGVDLTYIHSNFLQLASASFLISVLLSVYLYVRSRYAAPAQLALGGNSGKGKDLQLPPSWSDTFCSASLVNSLNLNVFFFLSLFSSGNVVYDFFKGRELNPRIKDFDLKFFCEMRPGLIGWVSCLETPNQIFVSKIHPMNTGSIVQ